jgi:hypothetical protein
LIFYYKFFFFFLEIEKNLHSDPDHSDILDTRYQIAYHKGLIGDHQTALQELESIHGD